MHFTNITSSKKHILLKLRFQVLL